MNDADIFKLARAAGIAIEWTDAYGKPQSVTPDTLRTILKALELPCSTDTECTESAARLERNNAGSGLPALLIADLGHPLRLQLRQGDGLHGQAYRIELEDGGSIEGRFSADPSMPPEIVAIDRHGYHRLVVGDLEATLAVAPSRCFGVGDALQAAGKANGRAWGLAVQLYSLRRDGDGGVGDFSALAQMAGAAAAHGAAALAISPVHAGFSASYMNFSPYSPSSRLFLNVLHIDPAQVAGAAAMAAAIAGSGAEFGRLEQLDLVDWPAAAASRLTILRRLYQRHFAGKHNADFDAFRTRGGEALEDHARFEALHEHLIASGHSGDWRTWPAEYRDPRGAAVEAFAGKNAEQVGFHAFLQWQAASGLAAAQQKARDAGMPIGLITDLAVGAESGGSQAWSRQGEIINGLSVGAPPDVMNVHGQSWGLGAFSPLALKRTGYRAYIEMLRAAFANAGGVRIDHVLGLARLWLVPDGASALQGAYLHYPMEDLLRLVALESWRHRAIVIGEDLGTIPEGFGDRLARAGLLGIRVLWFQRDGSRFLAPAEWSSQAMATTTTHDLPTFAGWWEGRDIAWRTRLDLLAPGSSEAEEHRLRDQDRAALWQGLRASGCAHGEIPAATPEQAPVTEALAFLGATPAPLAMVPIEDVLCLPEQPNVPGTVDSHPNWRRRLGQPVGRLLDEPQVAARLAALDRARHNGNGNGSETA